MKNNRTIFSLIFGILGAILGLVDAEFGRSMCYYASDRAKCYGNFTATRYVFETVIGFALFYLIASLAIKLISLVIGKIKKP